MKKLPTKKYCLIFVLFVLFLCSCSSKEEQYASYDLINVYLDGEEVSGVEGELRTYPDGSANITIDGHSCEIDFLDDEILINKLEGNVVSDDKTISLEFPSEGITYVFSQGIKNVIETPEIEDEENKVSGRLYFRDVSDEYEEYEDVSMEVSGTKNNNGGFTLYSSAYSEDIPVFSIDSKGDGLFMDYETSCRIKEEKGTYDSLIEEYDIADPFKFRPWDAPSGYYESAEPVETDITVIEGSAGNAFDFEIKLIENAS